MPKIVTSPIKRFPGTATISDPLTYPQFFAIEDAFDNGKRLIDEAKELGKDLSQQRYNAAVMGGVLQCIEDHDLKGVPKPLTIDNFPASPGASSMRLSAWLIKEVSAVYVAEDEDPNE